MTILTLDPESMRAAKRRQAAGLRRLRDRLGLTQSEMARRLHIAASTYRTYESGKAALTIMAIEPWGGAFGVSAAELVDALGILAGDRQDRKSTRLNSSHI